jgi:hypothetical protein
VAAKRRKKTAAKRETIYVAILGEDRIEIRIGAPRVGETRFALLTRDRACKLMSALNDAVDEVDESREQQRSRLEGEIERLDRDDA